MTHAAAAPATKLDSIRARRTHASGSAGEQSCDPTGVLGMLSPVLGLLGQDALLAVACDVTVGLVQPRLGVSLPAASSVDSPAAAVLGVIAASQRLLHEQLSGKVLPVGMRALGGPGVLRDSQSSQAASGPAAGTARFHAGAPSYGTRIASAQAAAPAHASAAAQAGAAHKHGLFGSSVTGTEALFALLAADWALLIAVLTWRYSRRWIRGPRFA